MTAPAVFYEATISTASAFFELLILSYPFPRKNLLAFRSLKSEPKLKLPAFARKSRAELRSRRLPEHTRSTPLPVPEAIWDYFS